MEEVRIGASELSNADRDKNKARYARSRVRWSLGQLAKSIHDAEQMGVSSAIGDFAGLDVSSMIAEIVAMEKQ